jgi:hypothetical protein
MRFPDEPVIAHGNIAEPGQPPQNDQQARGRQAEGENRHQALSPGDDERLGSARAGRLLREGCWGPGNRRARVSLLYLATQNRTEQLHAERSRRAPSARPLNGRTSIANSQPRSRPGEDQQMRTRLPRRRHAECTGCAERRSALTGRSRRWGLAGAAWSGGRASAESAVFDANSIIDAQLRRPDLSTPGIGSPVPAKCPAGEDPAHRAEPEVRQRRGPIAASLLERTSKCRIYEGSLSLSYLTTPPASR